MWIYNRDRLEYIGETDKRLEINDIVKKDGEYYLVCAYEKEKDGEWCIIVHGTEYYKNKEDSFGEQYITCPVCGYKDKDSWEMHDEYDDHWECKNCGSILQVQRNIEITYDTYVKEPNKNIVEI